MSIFSLVAIRLKPMLLERAYQELDINFKYANMFPSPSILNWILFMLDQFLYIFFSRSYWRSLITIAYNLNRSRELRGLFSELSEKLIEPWRQNNWSLDQVKSFLPAITQSVLDLEVSRLLLNLKRAFKMNVVSILFYFFRDQDVRCLWDRYMQVITTCLIKMYHI